MYSGFWQTREDNHVKLTGRIVLSTTFMCILFANSYDTDQVLKKKEERERGTVHTVGRKSKREERGRGRSCKRKKRRQTVGEEGRRREEKDRKETEVGITTCMENQGTLELVDKIVLFSIPARER